MNRFCYVKFCWGVCAQNNIEVFPKWSVIFTEFSEFRENDNHWSMSWAQFKDPVSYMCCAGAVVACWALTQEVAGWQGFESFYWMTYFCHWIQRMQWKNLQLFRENPIVNNVRVDDWTAAWAIITSKFFEKKEKIYLCILVTSTTAKNYFHCRNLWDNWFGGLLQNTESKFIYPS